MHCRGFIYAPNTAYDQLSTGIDLSEWFFYIDINQQAGPTRLATDRPAFTMNGTAVQPMVLLLGQDATTSSWPNRGSLGGSLTAVNIRSEDVGLSTPFTDGTKSVRFSSASGGTRRYYVASDTSFADIASEDFVWEVYYTREGVEGTFSNIQFNKRDHTAGNPNGYAVYSSTASNLQFIVKSTGTGFAQSLAASTGSYCWQHMGGYLDNSDSTSNGFAAVLGSQSTGATTHSPGSMSNTAPFTVGDSTISGSYTNTEPVACRIAYIAIWKRSTWMAGGASNDSDYKTEARARQSYLSGVMDSVSSATPSSYSMSQYRSTKTYNSTTGEWEHHLLGPGCVAPDQYKLAANSEIVGAIKFETTLSGIATAETFTTGWTYSGTASAVNGVLLPTSNLRGITSTGVSQTGTAGTGLKYATFTLSAASANKNMTHIWIKPGAAPFGYIQFPDAGISGGDINRHIIVNFSTGAVTIGSGAIAAWATKYTNGWWLVYISAKNSTAVGLTYRVGFCNSTSTFNLTSDGTSVDGYMWGLYYVATATSNYPDQIFPYFGTNSNANAGPFLAYSGSAVNTQTKSLWWEVMQEDSVNGFGITAYPMQFSTDGNNAEYFYTGATAGQTEISVQGITGGATQWTINSAAQTGDNTMSSGKRVRFNTSIATNDIVSYNTTGTIGSDTSATPLSSATNIRLGNNASGTIAGRGPAYTRFGIKKTTSTNSNGPSGSGINES